MSPLRFEIVTAERQVYVADDVDMVVAPSVDGELGILPHHAPLLAMLQPGELRVKQGGSETSMAITGGFLEVTGEKVVVLADAAEPAEEIDITRAEAALQRARERLARQAAQPAEEVDLARAEAALRRSLARLRVAQRRRRSVPTPPQS